MQEYREIMRPDALQVSSRKGTITGGIALPGPSSAALHLTFSSDQAAHDYVLSLASLLHGSAFSICLRRYGNTRTFLDRGASTQKVRAPDAFHFDGAGNEI